MNSRQWASLLDDEGVDDVVCTEEFLELEALRESLSSTKSMSHERAKATDGVPYPRARGRQVGGDEDNRSGGGSAGRRDPTYNVEGGVDKEESQRSETDDWYVDAATREPLRDLSAQAVWSVSTAKPGNGVDQLLDSSVETYWQSDGPQPHSISAQFSSKLKLSEVRLFLSLKKDESYTPAIISIRVGSSFHDLRVVRRNKELNKPQGWVRIPLGESGIAALDDYDDLSSLPSDEDETDINPGDLAERDQRRRVRADHRRRKEAKDSGSTGVKGQHTVEAEQGGNVSSVETRRWRKRDTSFVRAHMLQIMIHTNHQNGRDSHVRQVKVLGPAQQVFGGSSRFSSTAFQMYETIR